MSSLQYLEVVFCFLSLTELTSFLFWVLCCEVFKFWVNSFDGLWNKEWQEPKLGNSHGTPKIIQGHQKVKALGCPRKASPLSSTSIGNLLGAIFLFTNIICVLLGASCMIWVFSFYLSQSSLLYTPFERAIHEL